MNPSKITAEDFVRILREGMPYADRIRFEVVAIEQGTAMLRLPVDKNDVRPGGTIAGPLLFALADMAVYAAVMSEIGPVPLTVTTDATIHFLRRPDVAPLIAKAKLLKVGRRLAVGNVEIASEDGEGIVAHAVMTYSIPV